MPGRSYLFTAPIVVSIVLGLGAASVEAQFGGRGSRGGGAALFDFRGTPGIDLFGQLRQAEVRDELKLTDEQIDQATELGDRSRLSRDESAPFFARMGEAQTEDERAAIREEMQAVGEERRQEAVAELKQVLSEDQFLRLEQLALRSAGAAVLARDEIAADLKLTDEQKKELDELSEERREAGRNLGFRASSEDRQKFREEWDGKLLAVLTSEQRETWNAKLGPPPGGADAVEQSPTAASAGSVATSADSSSQSGATAGLPSPTAVRPDGGEVSTEPVVASFGPAAQTPMDSGVGAEVVAQASATEAGSSTGEPMLSFNFQFAPWMDVMKLFAQLNGLTLHPREVPTGTFTHFDDGRYTPAEALDILNGYLIQEGYILVRRDRFLVSLNYDKPIPPNLIETVSMSQLDKRGRNEYLTVVFPLEGVEADEVAEEVKELLGPQGKVVPLAKANRIIVTDIGGNLRQVRDQIEHYIVPEEDMVFRSFVLQHVDARDCERAVRDLFGLDPSGVQSVSAGVLGGASATSGRTSSRGSTSSRYRSSRDSRSRGGDPRSSSRNSSPQQQQQTQQRGTANQTPASTVQVSVDERTNRLLVKASPTEMKIIEEIVEAVDVDEVADGYNRRQRDNEPYQEVYQVRTADPIEASKSINALYPGAVVNEDQRARRLLIHGTSQQHRDIATLIRKLDGDIGGGTDVAVVQLMQLDPHGAAGTLRTLFAGDDAPVIEADAIGRRLLIRGSSDQVTQVKKLLAQMGEDGSGVMTAGSARGTGPIRTIPLGGRDPQMFLQMLERTWSASDTTPIRIVVPAESNPVRDQRVPSAGRSVMPDRPAADRTPVRPAREMETRLNRDERPSRAEDVRGPRQTEVRPEPSSRPGWNSRRSTPAAAQTTQPISFLNEEDGDEDERAADSADLEEDDLDDGEFERALDALLGAGEPESQPSYDDELEPRSRRPLESRRPARSQMDADAEELRMLSDSITIALSGGDLVLTSTDEEALDRMERLIERMALAMPARTRWSVFYLTSADANEASLMLKQIFPASSVTGAVDDSGGLFGGFTSGLASLGSGLMNMTGVSSLNGEGGQTLQIIPEPRSNALFVSGPSALVKEVEEVLQVLDAAELPNQLSQRAPRMIPVEHADINQVAQIVKDVFKEEITPSAANAQGNPMQMMQMMMGSGRGSGRDSRGGGRQPMEVKLTVGVDTRTSNLIVSCSDSLFRQVEALVHSLDDAAFESRRTVRVVSLENANTQMLQQAITSLLPQVSVSTTTSSGNASGSSGSSSSQPSSSRGSSSGSGDMDAMRQMWQQRMQSGGGSSRFGSGTRGSSGFGGRGSSGFGGRTRGRGR